MRCRNEEETLGACLAALTRVTTPHEVLVVLDRCTDGSEVIAKDAASKNPNVRLMNWLTPVSKAGYENLATDARSPHSLVSHFNTLWGARRYEWAFKWDADFLMTPEIAAWVNDRTWESDGTPFWVWFDACDMDGQVNSEPYLTSGPLWFDKNWFWEDRYTTEGPRIQDHSGMAIPHLSTVGTMKPYWAEPPWFIDADTPEAASIRAAHDTVVRLCGPEPVGMARASNQAAIPTLNRIYAQHDALVAAGICPVGGWML
jgi:glycosyltransferase involved in cell wall biosynthesis